VTKKSRDQKKSHGQKITWTKTTKDPSFILSFLKISDLNFLVFSADFAGASGKINLKRNFHLKIKNAAKKHFRQENLQKVLYTW
jgi:hypothetical protein